jgi:type IV pilus assembly protein PilM
MLHTKHSKAFPVPRILLFHSVGIDISDRSVKYAELVVSGKELSLGRHGLRSIPEGVISSGRVENPEALAQVLSKLKEEEKLSYVRVALPEEQVYLFRTHLSGVSFSDLRNTIDLQIEEHIPISASDAVFDFDVIGEHDGSFDLQVVATSRELINGYLEAFSKAKLIPVSFELEAQAIARAIVKTGDKSTSMIVDFGGTRTGISIIQGDMILFTSTVSVGGVGMSEAIARSMNVSVDEAEKIKQSTGLSEAPENREAFSAMVSTLSVLRDEINRTYTYWQTQKDDEGAIRPKIESIVVCGGDANLPGFTEYLSASLRIPVICADPWVNITNFKNYIPAIHRKEALSFATAIGLALADFEYD